MRLGTTSTTRKRNPWPLWIGIGLLGMVLAIVLTRRPAPESMRPEGAILYCDAETVEGDFWVDGEYKFKNAARQDREFARSGKHACKLTWQNRYGMSVTLPELQGGRVYAFSVWRYSLHGYGTLTLQGSNQNFFKVQTSDAVESEASGWERLEAILRIPESKGSMRVKAYVSYKGSIDEPVWFDDFALVELPGERSTPCPQDIVDGLKKRPFEGYSLKVHREEEEDETQRLHLRSFHTAPIQVLGYGTQSAARPIMLSDKVNLPAYADSLTAPVAFDIPAGFDLVFYSVAGNARMYSQPILPWPMPGNRTDRQRLFDLPPLQRNAWYEVTDSLVTFPAGQARVDRDIVIPAGYVVRFAAGCQRDFVQGAGFISASPVLIEGTAAAPVRITSPDSSMAGFTVLNAGAKTVLHHAEFTGLNTLERGDWFLTGAVNVYGDSVEIRHVTIAGNVCEDGLNLIRGVFDVEDLTVRDTKSDGFDADFCTGVIRNSLFERTGNDGMDFSGSEIEVIACRVLHPGDKGISVGEEAFVRMHEYVVEGAPIGMASKDLSRLEARTVQLIDCRLGITAFRKKPEYGPAGIFVEGLTATGVDRLFVIERGSVLEVDGEKLNRN